MAETNKIDLSNYFSEVKSNDPVVQQSGKQSSTKDDIHNLLDLSLPAVRSNVSNELAKGKEKVFGADLDHHKFERYYAHPNFSKLGFNPFLDNESIYNQNSSFSDDFRRTWGQWTAMTKSAFFDAASFGPTSDREAAKNMERQMAIGSSSRGGIGGFANNLFLSSGYTVGIMGEILAEEAAMFLGTVVSGGVLGEAAAVRTGVNISRFGKALFSGAEWAKKANKVIKGLDALQDVNTARGAFNAIGKGALGTGKFAAKQLVPESYQFLSNFNKLENLTGMAKAGKGFGSFYRDVRNVRLAFGESAMEGGSVENDMIGDLYSDFVKTHGRDPNEEEAIKIRQTAKSAGLSTTWANLPVIYFSNNIVMGNMFKTFSPMRRMLPTAENRFYKTMLTKEGFKVVEKNAKNAFKGLIQPKTYGKVALNYISGNLTEGLQESAQEVISGTNKDYYKGLYNNSTKGGYYDALSRNIDKQMSAEGLETFASGFFMGGIIGGASNMVSAVNEKRLQFFDKEYAAKKGAAISAMQQKVDTLNKIYEDPLKYFNQNVNNLAEQNALSKKMEEAQQSGNQKLYQDLKNRSLAQQLWTVFEMDQVDTFKQRFRDLKNLSPEELVGEAGALPSDNYSEAIAGLEDISTKMDQFKKNYDFVKSNLQNPFNPSNYKVGTAEREEEGNRWVAFQEAQKDLVFMKDGMTNSLKRMSSIMNEAVQDVGVSGMLASDITNLFSLSEVSNDINILKQELKVFGKEDLVTPEANKLKKGKEKKLKHLEEFANAMSALVVERASIEEKVTEEESETGNIVAVKEKEINPKIYNDALNAYKAYIKSQANGGLVSEKNLETAFEKMVDHYDLKDDAKNFNASINTLINPGAFAEYALRKKEVIAAEHRDRAVRIAQSLKAYEAIMNKNDLLKALYDENMFFDPKEWEAFESEGIMPKRIYNVSGKREQVLSTSSQYNTAVNLIKQYAENVLNIPLTDIPLMYKESLDAYNTLAREKLAGDTRTYEELAEQYGFDPKATSTTLPLREVLEKIIDSEFATEEEQALAKRLVKLAKSDETVTFAKDLAGPGVYTLDQQTVIDARYSAEEYKENAQSYPLEVSILREEINRRVYGALQEDSEFAKEIDDLRLTAIEYYNQNKEERPFVGLTNSDAFIKEVMTSNEFREFLAQIEYEPTQKSGWQQFVDSVIDYISRAMGIDSTGSALNAAISIITNKIDNIYNESQEVKGGSASTTAAPKTRPQDKPIDEIKREHPELVQRLIDAYRRYNESFEEVDPTKMFDPDYKGKTDPEIETSPEFKRYVESNTTTVRTLFDEYYASQPVAVRQIVRRPGTQEVLPGIPGTNEEIEEEYVTEGMREDLRRLEYTDAEIDEFTPYVARSIIIYGESKSETAARLAQIEEDLDQEREEIRAELKEMIDGITDLDEFDKVDAIIIANTIRYTTNADYTSKEINKMLLEKKREIAFKTEFDELNVDDYVVLNDVKKDIRGVYRVGKKTKNQLTLVSDNENGKPYVINRKDFNDANKQMLVFKYKPGQEQVGMDTNEITDAEAQISNEDVNAIQNIADDDWVNSIAQGNKANVEDSESDFLDSLDDIC